MRTLSIIGSVLACLILSASAPAQERYQSPSGPTLSPYLDYFRIPTGVYDNYNTYVRPRQMLNQRLAQQQVGIRQVERQVGQIQLQMRGASSGLTRPAPIAPTGRVPAFMNYSHYYSSPQGGR